LPSPSIENEQSFILKQLLADNQLVRRQLASDRQFDSTMKQIPEEELLELLEMAKVAEQKARVVSELATTSAQKWKQRLKDRQAAQHK